MLLALSEFTDVGVQGMTARLDALAEVTKRPTASAMAFDRGVLFVIGAVPFSGGTGMAGDFSQLGASGRIVPKLDHNSYMDSHPPMPNALVTSNQRQVGRGRSQHPKTLAIGSRRAAD
jgi:hypothetical protein